MHWLHDEDNDRDFILSVVALKRSNWKHANHHRHAIGYLWLLRGPLFKVFCLIFLLVEKRWKMLVRYFRIIAYLLQIFILEYENIQTIFSCRIYFCSATDIRIRMIKAGCEFVSVIWSTVLVRNAKWIMNSASDFASNALNVKLFLTPLCIGKSCGEKKKKHNFRQTIDYCSFMRRERI